MTERNEFFKNIKVIGFDFDDTLVNEQYYITTKWKAVLKRYSSLSLDLEKTFFKIYQEKGSSYKFHLDDTLHTLRIDIKYRDRILSEFKENKGEERLLAGVIEFLKMVKYNGLRVGIITDGKESRQKERIKKAKELGFITHLLDGSEKCAAKEYADFFYEVDINDIKRSAQVARKLKEEGNIIAVYTQGHDVAYTVAYAAREAGLPGIEPQAALNCKNKILARQILSKAGVENVKFATAKTAEEATIVAGRA